jgi:hypothetical protein
VSRWRATSRSIIAHELAKHPSPKNADDLAVVFGAVSKRYPWGERKLHPYKVWRSEVAIAKDRLLTALVGRGGIHTAFRVRCPACNAGAGIPCKPIGGVADDHMVARDAELDGDIKTATEIRSTAFHDARLVKVGLGSAQRETLPLWETR